jgi:2-polyprenyl-3-methyl-5-hydroxy-6-metoxy-1,4-benzoquinol methylase
MVILCPICKNEMILFTENRDLQRNNGEELYKAFECKDCNILFQYPFWNPDETHRFYEANYYAHAENAIIPRSIKLLDFYLNNGFSARLTFFLRNKLFPFFPCITKAKTVLDIGCGKGLFLDLMKRYSKITYGLEPSQQASDLSAKKGHIMIDKSSFYSLQPDMKFDLITMFQVAEHLSVSELFEENIFSKMYVSLSAGGQLVIETPNYECDYARKFKSNWRALEMPRHLVIFSPKSLSKLLTDIGFKVNVYTRVSPIDVRESFKLKFRENTFRDKLLKLYELAKIAFFQKRNSSLLTVVAQK